MAYGAFIVGGGYNPTYWRCYCHHRKHIPGNTI
nr:MAG TPA: hypothetical protein [Caudoviricetes sp.]